MAIFLFTKAIVEGMPIGLLNHGEMRRDFSYIDDVTRMVLVDRVPKGGHGQPDGTPAGLYNVGNQHPEELLYMVVTLAVRSPAVKTMLPMQAGDVTETFADVGDLMRDVGFRPDTSIDDGISGFVAWYRDHYKV
jgi:UDP-glucuronate 4-epimerase